MRKKTKRKRSREGKESKYVWSAMRFARAREQFVCVVQHGRAVFALAHGQIMVRVQQFLHHFNKPRNAHIAIPPVCVHARVCVDVVRTMHAR